MRMRKALLIVLVNALVSAVLLEGVFVLLLKSPRIAAAVPAAVRRVAQQMYRHFDRMLIQFDPACAQYDPGVTYTLKPGTCTFSNLEFSTTYNINKAGLRDTDDGLTAPDVIVLGDSHAMGWGVEQNDTLAQVIAERTGVKVLNAAVSSYGTVRELKLLGRLDTSRARVVIVQYADNDLPENLAFKQHGNTLPITDRAHYDEIVRHYASQQSYYPFKYLFRLFMKVTRLEAPEPDQLEMKPLPMPEEVELFLNALEHAGGKSLKDVNVVVFAINQQPDHPRAFINALIETTHTKGQLPFVRRLLVADTTRMVTDADFYVLDDHMRPSGHQKVGDYLASLVNDLLASTPARLAAVSR